jgi:hypothetical protein
MSRRTYCYLMAILAMGAGALVFISGLPAHSISPPRHSAGNVAVGEDKSDGTTRFIKMVTDPNAVFEVQDVPKPDYLASVELAPFNTRITRIAGDPGLGFQTVNGSGKWGEVVRHHYSTDQPWNSTNTLIALQNSGSPKQLYLDGETYQVKYGSCENYHRRDDRWHPSPGHPNERINADGAELMWFDVVTCTRTRYWSLPFPVKYLGSSKGNPSADGRFVVLNDATRAFVVDMDPEPPFAPYPNSRIGPPIDTSDCGLTEGCRMTWASISPSGRYAVVHYRGDRERVYDVNPATLELTPRPMPKAYAGCQGAVAKGFIYELGHADMTRNPFDNDEDVIVGQEHCRNRGKTVDGKLMGGVVMVRLRDGMITPLTDPHKEAYPDHISAQGTDRPGWVYVSYFPGENGKRFNDEIVAVKLDGSKTVQRFCHKRSVSKGCYRCESHGVPSRDGERVLFASNWNNPSGPIQAYIVDARPVHGTDRSAPAKRSAKITQGPNAGGNEKRAGR